MDHELMKQATNQSGLLVLHTAFALGELQHFYSYIVAEIHRSGRT